jgi:hypothetical protein
MQHHHGGWRTIVDSTIVEGTIRKHQEGRCEKGSYQKGIAFALLCNRIYVKNKVSDQSNPKWYKASLPRESHELHQSLGLWDWCQKDMSHMFPFMPRPVLVS